MANPEYDPFEVGHSHLRNAEAALKRQDEISARQFFEWALAEFQGAELLVGQGHALRGLGTIELQQGHTLEAEELLVRATKAYRSVRSVLDEVDDSGDGESIRNEALAGEAAARVLLGELFLNVGRDTEAREARDWSRAAYDAVGRRPSEAGLWALTGRLALRDGEPEESIFAYEQALKVHVEQEDHRNEVVVLLSLAEAHRLCGEDDQGLLLKALERSQDLKSPSLQARVLSGRGASALQRGDLERALVLYNEVLALADKLGDNTIKGYAHLNLTEICSQLTTGDPLEHGREAVRLLGLAGASHGIGAALHHLASHAVRRKRYLFALSFSEGARRLWRGMDPTRGVGQALRLQVKSLAGLRSWGAVLAVAKARANLMGQSSQNALDVWEFYRERAPKEWLDRLASMSEVQVYALAEELVSAALESFLEANDWTLEGTAHTRQILAKVDRMRQVDGEPDQYGEQMMPKFDENLPPDEDFYRISESDLRGLPES